MTDEDKPLDILIVDDEPDIAFALEATMGYEGVNTTTANGGQEGIDEFKRRKTKGKGIKA